MAVVSSLVLGALSATADSDRNAANTAGVAVTRHGRAALDVSAVPWGPTQAQRDAQLATVKASPVVKQALTGVRSRLLSFELVDQAHGIDTLIPRFRYRATFYDYTRNRTVYAEGTYGEPGAPAIRITFDQPLPTYEEFHEAVAIAKADPLVGPSIVAGRRTPYRPMPPMIDMPKLAGRMLAVGLLPTIPGDTARHEIVGVDMVRRAVVRFPNGAPPHSMAVEDACGIESADQPTTPYGEVGQSLVTVKQGDEVVWRFVVVRPSASSGINGSGVELRHVEYRGKRVLERGHAPILNVKYEDSPCGPFRDWLYEEGAFEASGREAPRGFIDCPEAPRTIAETGEDRGTFRGVAVHASGNDITLVSELEAGWYRYSSEWRLSADGTIRPRFHFGAVANACTCNLHIHHVYWRLDFAVNGQDGDLVEMHEGSEPSAPWEPVETEQRFLREHNRTWRVVDSAGDTYTVYPGVSDGIADGFGAGDVWVVRGHANEIDDGIGFTEDLLAARAHIDDFVDGEGVVGEDVALWYGAHVRHGSNDAPVYEVGPELRFSAAA